MGSGLELPEDGERDRPDETRRIIDFDFADVVRRLTDKFLTDEERRDKNRIYAEAERNREVGERGRLVQGLKNHINQMPYLTKSEKGELLKMVERIWPNG
jgi:hypothetical protein